MNVTSMDNQFSHAANEALAASAFGKQSGLFDTYYGHDTIIRYKRQFVRTHVLDQLPDCASILELNAGTGEDALFFASKGHQVHATDISEGMLNVLRSKVSAGNLSDRITVENCSFTSLNSLKGRGPYDLVFSNFAGLNCTGELHKTLGGLSDLLKPGGRVTLVLLPPFCLWESLLLFRGKFKTAFRRWFAGRGAKAHVEGNHFRCWYYSPGYVVRSLRGSFEPLKIEGLCTIVPPSYIEGFAEKYPRLYRLLLGWEQRWKGSWPWKYIGDYYVISLRKTDQAPI